MLRRGEMTPAQATRLWLKSGIAGTGRSARTTTLHRARYGNGGSHRAGSASGTPAPP